MTLETEHDGPAARPLGSISNCRYLQDEAEKKARYIPAVSPMPKHPMGVLPFFFA